MKTSFILLLVLGYLYLHVLDHVSRFLDRNLQPFKESLAEATGVTPSEMSLLRTPTDLLIEI